MFVAHRGLRGPGLARSTSKDVAREFDGRAGWWDTIYRERSFKGHTYRLRQDVALSWVDALALPTGSRILEVGCGAGHTAVELARRGFTVCALDGSEAMLERARENALAAGVGNSVVLVSGDAQRLDLDSNSFDLVIAIGVVAWLQAPTAAVEDMARVTRPGGHVLMTSVNLLDAAHLLDPRSNPLLRPLRTVVRLGASVSGRPRPPRPRVRNTRHLRRTVRRMLSQSGLVPVRQATVGFSFTMLGKPLLGARCAMRVERALQRRADNGGKLVASLGSVHLFLAQKPLATAAGR
jgi:ubiquinone/menaquinone biosynthesis C-methylase UbiE